MDAPVMVFVLAVLAVPGVTSIVTSLVKGLAGAASVDTRVIVYAVSLVLTGLIAYGGTTLWPTCVGTDPAGCVAGWLQWTVINAELSRRVYELLLAKLGLA